MKRSMPEVIDGRTEIRDGREFTVTVYVPEKRPAPWRPSKRRRRRRLAD